MEDNTLKAPDCTTKSDTPEELAKALSPDAQLAGDNWSTRCPAHDDDRASLSIGYGQEGQIVFKCHAGCEQREVLAALSQLGLWQTPKLAVVTKGSHVYHDENGEPLYRVKKIVKEDKKEYPVEFFLNGSWVRGSFNQHAVDPVLYNLPAIKAASVLEHGRIYVAEGEKDADTLIRLGFIATTNQGGAGNWKESYTEALAGRHVCLVPDNDDQGWKRAKKLAEELGKVCKSVKLLNIGLLVSEHGDITDLVESWREMGVCKDDADEKKIVEKMFNDLRYTRSATDFDFAQRRFNPLEKTECLLKSCNTLQLITAEIKSALSRRLGVDFLALHLAKLPKKISDGLDKRDIGKRKKKAVWDLTNALSDVRTELGCFLHPATNQHFFYLPSQSAHYEDNSKMWLSVVQISYTDITNELAASWNAELEFRLTETDLGKVANSSSIDTMTPEIIDEGRYLCARGSALDLSTGKVIKLSPTVFRHSALQITLPEQPVTTRPTYWEKFLAGIGYLENAELTEYFENLTLYFLTTSVKKNQAYFLVGGGNNGKSTYLKWLTAVVGEHHVSSASLGDLEKDFGPAAMIGKRLNLSSESDDKEFVATGKLKAIVTGDAIQVDRKNRDMVKTVMATKLIFSMNRDPIITDHTEGWRRRFRVIRFDRHIPKSEEIDDFELLLLDEAPEIVSWLWWKHTGGKQPSAFNVHFPQPAIVDEWADQVMNADEDPVTAWIKETVELTDTDVGTIAPLDLYSHFESYCVARGYRHSFKSSAGFARKVPTCMTSILGGELRKKGIGQNRHVYTNIKLNAPCPSPTAIEYMRVKADNQ